jgi:type IV pilus assembly protein PilA
MDSRIRALRGEDGFSLIELLVVILIIAVLAAIVIPAFLNQRAKAFDAGAKELAHAAEVAAETYATDNDGSYVNLTAAVLNQYDSTIPIAAASGNAYVATVTGATQAGYTITVTPASGAEVYSITRVGSLLLRSCTVNGVSGTGGGCINGSW